MPYITRRTYIAVGRAEINRKERPDTNAFERGPALFFYRASGEAIRSPSDVLALLTAEGFEMGALRARNPVTHDQWWIPILPAAKAGLPYAVALGAVIRSWLKERKRRQVRLEIGRIKISAATPADLDRILVTLGKHGDTLTTLQVSGANSPPKLPARKAAKKRVSK